MIEEDASELVTQTALTFHINFMLGMADTHCFYEQQFFFSFTSYNNYTVANNIMKLSL